MSQQGQWSEAQLIQLLSEVELFEGLPNEDLLRIASACHGAVVPAGKWIFEEGEPGDAFYIVFGGSVEILKAKRGEGQQRLAVRRKGDGFGEMSLLNSAPRSAGAKTVEDTQLIVLRQEAFLDLLGGDGLAVRLLQNFSTALRALNVRFSAMEKSQKVEKPDPNEVSRTLQRQMLPDAPPRMPKYDMGAGTTREPNGRGHTIWDWVNLNGSTALVVMEVRSDGLPPAHFLAQARVAIRAFAADALGPRDLLVGANAAMAQAQIPGVDQFVECGVLVPNDAQVLWGCAGKMYGGVLRSDGSRDDFKSNGPSLGVMPGFAFEDTGRALGSEDAILVLSGGGEGLYRGAADLVSKMHGQPAADVVATVQKAIRKAQGDDAQEISILYLRRH